MENEMILYDRLEIIKTTIAKFGEDTFYLSFSGGKDSTVVHHLVDMAIPNNKIPRVYSNTGIEYNSIVKYVQSMAEKDERIKIIKPQKNIKTTLEEKGYPFKSKLYSQHYSVYRRNKDEFHRYIDMIGKNPTLLQDFDFIHNLPKGVKTCVKYYFNLREREREVANCTFGMMGFPNMLRYQWFLDMNISDKCCLEMKEKPLKYWEKENKRPNKILGLMREEGGRRSSAKCHAFKEGKLSFAPLVAISKEWEDWFIETHKIDLCELYYPPFNFKRTGCKGCPFNLNLQEDLSVLERYFPAEKKQCEIIWKPVYDEYRKIGYRLDSLEQTKLF